MLTLLKGYDWLCLCGESNYDEERECAACNCPRKDKEINYLTDEHVNENDEEDEICNTVFKSVTAMKSTTVKSSKPFSCGEYNKMTPIVFTPEDLKKLTSEDWDWLKELMQRHPEFKTLVVSKECFEELKRAVKKTHRD